MSGLHFKNVGLHYIHIIQLVSIDSLSNRVIIYQTDDLEFQDKSFKGCDDMLCGDVGPINDTDIITSH